VGGLRNDTVSHNEAALHDAINRLEDYKEGHPEDSKQEESESRFNLAGNKSLNG
jgi:hypothetical protein